MCLCVCIHALSCVCMCPLVHSVCVHLSIFSLCVYMVCAYVWPAFSPAYPYGSCQNHSLLSLMPRLQPPGQKPHFFQSLSLPWVKTPAQLCGPLVSVPGIHRVKLSDLQPEPHLTQETPTQAQHGFTHSPAGALSSRDPLSRHTRTYPESSILLSLPLSVSIAV